MPKPTSTAAQVRGDIDRGYAGDRAPAIDPAAAPMETDAEAGGAPPTSSEIEGERRHIQAARRDRGSNAASPGRTPDGEGSRSHRPFLKALAFLAAIAGLAWAAAAWLV